MSAPAILRSCELVLPGRLGYREAVALQEASVQSILHAEGRERLILLEHPPVITLGRGFHRENLLYSQEWLEKQGVAVEESGRGGDVTYHGPGQIVGYPILDLREKPDLHLYLRQLEELMILTVADFGIAAGRKSGLTGIWVGDQKIGAIGVRVVRWIASHGFALNVNTNLKHFEFIIPCGIRDHGVTSLQNLLGSQVSMADVQASIVRNFGNVFHRVVIHG